MFYTSLDHWRISERRICSLDHVRSNSCMSLPLNFLWFWHVLYLSILHTRTRGVKGREGGGGGDEEKRGRGIAGKRADHWLGSMADWGVNWVVGVGIGVDIGVVDRRLRYPGQLDLSR